MPHRTGSKWHCPLAKPFRKRHLLKNLPELFKKRQVWKVGRAIPCPPPVASRLCLDSGNSGQRPDATWHTRLPQPPLLTAFTGRFRPQKPLAKAFPQVQSRICEK
jgi:hypothetical protein